MVNDGPILMNEREELIHQFRNFPVMRRDVISYENRLFAEPATLLRDVCHGHVVEFPKHVLVEGFDALFQPDLDAIHRAFCKIRQ